MRGDGMNGLAIAIFIGCLFLLIGPALLGGWIGGRFGKGGRVGGAMLGIGVGFLVTTATFFESTWSPPPRLTLEVPEQFPHEWVYLITDPSSSTEVRWSGVDAPFMSRSTTLKVPPSGIVRVRDLGRIDGDNVEATLSNGKKQWGKAGINAPKAFGGLRMVAYGFVEYPGNEPEPGSVDEATLSALLTSREAR